MSVRALAAAMVAAATLFAAAETLPPTLITTEGEPSVAAGMFYGYRTADEGPGNAAFNKAKSLAEREAFRLS